MPGPLVVWSDYACPFAWVGHRRLLEARGAARSDVTWRPFELHPEIPPTGVPRPRRTGGAGGAGTLRALLDEDGLRVRPSEVLWSSRLALEVAEVARNADAHLVVHDRLFAAAWEEGLDLGRPDVLGALVDECGLDGGAVVAEAATHTRLDRLVDALEDAMGLGITGTPSYRLADGRVLRGVQPLDALR